MFDQQEYHDFILNHVGVKGERVIGFYPQQTELASGRMSYWYWNGRVLLDYARPLETLSCYILNFCTENNISPDYFMNVPEGVNKLTDRLNFVLGGKQVQMRAKPKERGPPRDANFIGPVEAGDRVVIFEDVTTTGESLAKVLEKCLDFGLDVIATLCECNRMEQAATGRKANRVDLGYGVDKYIAGIGATHYSLTDATKIIPAAFELWTPPRGVKKALIAEGLKEEYQDHGIVPMDLTAV
ncbi:MAG: hypothetical protein HZB66_03075 [Candidatus Aenigmarchaeota archaeon]|nr:hypothetical protein [Candidatus Aenigmarchaeota archaeon]